MKPRGRALPPRRADHPADGQSRPPRRLCALFPRREARWQWLRAGVQVFDEATIVTLDTLNEAAPNHEGLLCADRLDFLEQALRSAPTDRPLLLFQHHPPFDTGLRYMDTIRLANPVAVWEVIARTRRPDYLFMGHLHRPIAGLWNGIPFHIQRALAHQVAFDLVTEGYIPGSHEAPDYSHVSVSGGQIVIHQCSFLYAGPRYSLHDKAALDGMLV